MLAEDTKLRRLGEDLRRVRGNPELPPDASVIVPVNAQADLEAVLPLLGDLAGYDGPHRLEVVLVVNNYDPARLPAEIEAYEKMGLRVVAVPDVRRPGEAVWLAARVRGLPAAASDRIILFDADCRVRNPRRLVDWYVEQLTRGARVAYTRVGYYEFRRKPSIYARLLSHHLARWIKRVVLRIPTPRGSNYAVDRPAFLRLYEEGLVADDLNVGLAAKARGYRVVYSGSRRLTVVTSGRRFTGGWRKLYRYLRYRLRYNRNVLPIRADGTGRAFVERYTSRRREAPK